MYPMLQKEDILQILNSEIAKILEESAKFFELSGQNPFKIRAFRNAAYIIRNLSYNLQEFVQNGGDLTKIPGIGKELSKIITQIINKGSYDKLEKLKKIYPSSLNELFAIKGLGAKTIKTLYEKLNVKNMQDLLNVINSGKIYTIKGFGQKKVQNILKGIKVYKKMGIRFRYDEAKEYAKSIKEYLLQNSQIKTVKIAGSFRRKKESVGDLDIVVISNSNQIDEYFTKYPKTKEILVKGDKKASIILTNNMQVDLRVFNQNSYATALFYFTGSKAHNIYLRSIAKKMGLKLNEYGLFKDDKQIKINSEKELYEFFDYCYIEPELREFRGEYEACKNNALPNLIKYSDLKGDLHMHTNYSDGKDTILQMATKAKELGLNYIAITDHSKHLKVANGLTKERFLEQFEKIDEVSKKVGIKILKGVECDILEDGELDFEISFLKNFDIVIGAIHFGFNYSSKMQTKRVLKALNSGVVNIFAHPTNRVIGYREAIKFDINEVIKCAIKNGVALEINSQPNRLDLNDIYIKRAKDMGAKFAINSDAHSSEAFSFLEYGINQARRGWLEKDDVINTKSFNDLKKFLKR
jgi:DNA polymerase (family 10)